MVVSHTLFCCSGLLKYLATGRDNSRKQAQLLTPLHEALNAWPGEACAVAWLIAYQTY